MTADRLRRLLVPLLLAAGVLAAAPAAAPATIYNVIVADENEEPTDVLRADQALFTITTGDLNGADLCVVHVGLPDPGDGSLSCDDWLVWGDVNTIANALGTRVQPIEAPYLQPGTWRVLADGGPAPGQGTC